VGEIAVGVSQGLFWTTGGGFSNLTDMNPTAPWQANEVAAYVAEMGANLPPAEYWNVGGRAYPDVSTLGHSELMVYGGSITEVDGTSASGPVLAGLISLLNDARLNAGLPPMGFLNPFLYSARRNNTAAFHDVTVGSNKDGDIQGRCSAFPTSCQYGFTAAPGWDPVTGTHIVALKREALISELRRLVACRSRHSELPGSSRNGVELLSQQSLLKIKKEFPQLVLLHASSRSCSCLLSVNRHFSRMSKGELKL
jgi:hypothetical protein